MEQILDALFDNIVIVIIVLNIVFRLIESVSKGDSVPEELVINPTDVDDDFEDKVVIPNSMDEEQVGSTLSFLDERMIQCKEVIAKLNQPHRKYKVIWRVCAPKMNTLHKELELEFKTLDSDLKSLKAAGYTDFDEENVNLLYSVKTAVKELSDLLDTLIVFYRQLPVPAQIQEAYNLLQHDIKPFVSHRRAGVRELESHIVPLPLSARSIERQIKFYLGRYIKWYFVNYEYLAEPALWPLLGRETPELLKQIAPEWSNEWRRWCGGIRNVMLPSTRRRSLQWRVEDSLNMWGDSLLAIYLMTLRYGPAATEALIEEVMVLYDGDDQRVSLVGAQKGNRNQQTKVPPPAIYLEISLLTLRNNGYLREADVIEQKWRQRVGNELHISLKSGTTIPFPINLVVEEMKGWVHRLRNTPWQSWNDECFDAIAGLTITRGQWGLVENHANQLIAGDHSMVLPDSIRWITLSYAAQISPQHVARVLKAAKTLHFDDQTWGENDELRPQSNTQDDLIAAIVLSDLFASRVVRYR